MPKPGQKHKWKLAKDQKDQIMKVSDEMKYDRGH
jgi:hypothetical protein